MKSLRQASTLQERRGPYHVLQLTIQSEMLDDTGGDERREKVRDVHVFPLTDAVVVVYVHMLIAREEPAHEMFFEKKLVPGRGNTEWLVRKKRPL